MEGMYIQNRIYTFYVINTMVSKSLFDPVFLSSRIAIMIAIIVTIMVTIMVTIISIIVVTIMVTIATITGLPRSGDILPRGVIHGFFTNTTQQGVSFVSHLATQIAHVLTNVAFTDVHLQKFTYCCIH